MKLYLSKKNCEIFHTVHLISTRCWVTKNHLVFCMHIGTSFDFVQQLWLTGLYNLKSREFWNSIVLCFSIPFSSWIFFTFNIRMKNASLLLMVWAICALQIMAYYEVLYWASQMTFYWLIKWMELCGIIKVDVTSLSTGVGLRSNM